MWHTLLYIRAQARARKHLVIGVVTCEMGHGFGVILGQLALVELVYSVACEGQGLLIEGKARGCVVLRFRLRRRALVRVDY